MTTLLRTLLILAASLPAIAQTSELSAVVRKHAPQFSGTILIVRDGKTLLRTSQGLAERSFEVANTHNTRYRIASITKLFTAVIALQLHDEGKLALDATIGSFLPGCGDATVHQLLHHTSGLADPGLVTSKEAALRDGLELYQRPFTPQQLEAKYCAAPRANPPGTGFFYNNGDYVLLGRLIETIERTPFASVLEARILRPLGMRDSGFLAQHEIVPRLARSYFVRDDAAGALTHDLPVYDENWYAAGAMYSTVSDLEKFATALFGGRLIKPASLARLMQPGLEKYGLGAWIYKDDIGGRTFTSLMRPGQIMGTNAVLYHVIEANLHVIILANTDRSNVDALAFELVKAILARR